MNNSTQFSQGNIDANITIKEGALQPSTNPETKLQLRKVFLFSGHMVDTLDRIPPRFPKEKVPIAANEIAEILAKLNAGPEDLALTQDAYWGNILFAEACLQLGVKLQLLSHSKKQFLSKNLYFPADNLDLAAILILSSNCKYHHGLLSKDVT